MVIMREAKKVDLLDYLRSVGDFLYTLQDILSKLYKEPSIFVEASQSETELMKAFQNYKRDTDKAFAIFEKKIINALNQLDTKLESELDNSKEVNVQKMNAFINTMNAYINVIQNYKNELPVYMGDIAKCFNTYIDDLNKTVENYPKDTKLKRVIKLNKLK